METWVARSTAVDGSRDLWVAVLTNGARDAARAYLTRLRAERDQGAKAPPVAQFGPTLDERWIGGPDFVLVCTWAGVEPEWAAAQIRRALRSEAEAMAFLTRFGQTAVRHIGPPGGDA